MSADSYTHCGWLDLAHKPDTWRQNELAHQYMRKKREMSGNFCTICFSRRCFPIDCSPPRGDKGLNKVIRRSLRRKTKIFYDSEMNPDFLDLRGGECVYDE